MLIVDEKGYEYRKWKGGSTFPVSAGICDIMKYCNNTFECHWHDGVELLCVVDGEIEHSVNGESYLMREGDFMFVNSGSIHEGRATKLKRGKYMVVSFLTSLLSPENKDRVAETYFGSVMSGENFPLLFLSHDNENAIELRRLCGEVSELKRCHPICYELEIKARLFKIWAILFSLASQKEITSKTYTAIDRMKKAVSYINENYQNKLGLDEIAAVCNISKSEFCRSFKRVMHRTPFDYIMDLRIRKSIELLDDGKGVTEAAMSSGFFDSSYYTKMFKRYMGCTPREYLKVKYAKYLQKQSCNLNI